MNVLEATRQLAKAMQQGERFIRFAKANHLAFLTLEVRPSNMAAIILYGRKGFRSVGRRKNYYDHPKEDAIIMTLYFDKDGNEVITDVTDGITDADA